MAATLNDIKNMNIQDLRKAKALCDKKFDELKDKKLATAQKWKVLAETFEKAQKKLSAQQTWLATTQHPTATVNTVDAQGNPIQRPATYMEALFKGKENALTLAYIADTINTFNADPTNITNNHSIDIAVMDTTGIEDKDMTPSATPIKRNLTDVAKDWVTDIGKGKGRGKGLAFGLLGFGVSEILTRLMTGSAMGVFGLLGEGLSLVPGALASLGGVASTAALAFPYASIALGGAAALVVLPKIKRKLESLKQQRQVEKDNSIENIIKNSIDANNQKLNPNQP